MFLDKEHRGPIELTEDTGILPMDSKLSNDVLPSQHVEANDNDLLLSASEREESRGGVGNGSYAYSGPDLSGFDTPSPAAPSNNASLSSTSHTSPAIDDLLGLTFPAAPVSTSPSLKLKPKPLLDPATFQRKWSQLTIASTLVYIHALPINFTVFNFWFSLLPLPSITLCC
jgi:hypothetical protein